MKINYAVIWAPFCNLFSVQYTQHTIKMNLDSTWRRINDIKQRKNFGKGNSFHIPSAFKIY